MKASVRENGAHPLGRHASDLVLSGQAPKGIDSRLRIPTSWPHLGPSFAIAKR